MKAYARLQKFAAVAVGTLFFVSGSFKLMDPVGTGLIVDEYWKLFHMRFMSGASVTLGVLLALTEALLGISLVTGLFRKPVRIAAAALTGFFTLVTLVLVIVNPAMDCGCFGEWLHLSHTASLVKNLILLALCAICLFPGIEAPARKKPRYFAACVLAAGVLTALVWSLWSIPVTDYTEFRPGVELAAAQADDIQSAEDFQVNFIYEKDGKTGSFRLEDISRAEGEGWTFVRTEPVERTAARSLDEVVSLSFLDREDRMADTLAARGRVLVVSVYDTEAMDDWSAVAGFLRTGEETVFVHAGDTLRFRPLLLVEAPLDEFDACLDGLSAADRDLLRRCSYQADRRKILALNRDNGGATYFADGMLVEKWGVNRLPSAKKLGKLIGKDPTDEMMVTSAEGRMAVHAYFLYALAVALLL